MRPTGRNCHKSRLHSKQPRSFALRSDTAAQRGTAHHVSKHNYLSLPGAGLTSYMRGEIIMKVVGEYLRMA